MHKLAVAGECPGRAWVVCSSTSLNSCSKCNGNDAQLVVHVGSTRRGGGLPNFPPCAQLGWQAGDEGNLLLAEAQGTPKVDRETATQLMFETFNVAVSLVS